ncbi:hypothetical protein VCSRO93_3525 [Vibrio cholerae]|nr:hypothetical protein VCSRO93_3525 [Vibrio cholerae]
MINDLNSQRLFTNLDIIQDKNIKTCRETTASQLKDFLSTLYVIRIELDNCLSKIWNNYDLMVCKESGMGHLVLSGAKDILPYVEERENFEAVLSSYVSGIRVVEGVIFEGAYVQACTLIRQELEALAQMRHIIKGTARPKKTPNIKILEKHYKLLYSELTDVAHLSCHDSVSPMAKGNSMSEMLISPLQYSFISNFDENLSKNLFATHYAILIEVIFGLEDYFRKHIPQIKLSSDTASKLNEAYNELVKSVPGLELESKTRTES